MEQKERSTKLDRAIYIYIFLNILKRAFQLTDCADCQFATNRSTLSVLVEWNHFADRIRADTYLITYGTLSPQFSSTVRSVHGSSIIFNDLQENMSYYFTIKSVTNGKILGSKSFTTCLLGEVGIKTTVSTTAVTFDWSEFKTGGFLTTISLNFTSYIVPPTTNNYIWNHLKPGTLYSFSLEFKQTHYVGLSLTQVFYMIIETAPCPPGWIGSFYSCYWIRKDYKKWTDASNYCESVANTVHLVDINTEEEYKFLSSYLRSLNEFSMLWTGLNDIDTENDLKWTDRTTFNLSTILLQTLPSNESDCYALQLNPVGPDHVFTELFCFLALPYICEHEVLVLPRTIKLKSEDVNENEATIIWDDLQDLFSTTSELFIWYQPNSGEEKQHSSKILPNVTKAVISGLKPGHHYYFAIMMRDDMGAQRMVSPILSVKTRPNPPRNITAGEVTCSSLQLLWIAPEESTSESFHHYLISFMAFKSSDLVAEDVPRDKTSVVLRNLKPFQSYEVYVQAVTEGGSLSCAEGPLFAITDPSSPVSIYIDNAEVWENRIIIHWEPPLEGCDEYHLRIQMSNKSNEVKEFSVTNTTLFQFDFMIPGVTYDIEVMAVRNGKRSKPEYITQTTRPLPVEIVFPIDIQTHSTVLYVGMPKTGIFDEVIVTYGDEIKRIATFRRYINITIEKLIPGEEYKFAVYSNSGNVKSKVYRVPAVKTHLVPPTNLREGMVTETSLELVWDKAEGHFNQYEVLCLNCGKQLVVQKVKREFVVFTKLTPGKLYNISLRTEKENYQDSIPVKQLICTLPSPVEYLNYNKSSYSLTLSWPEPVGVFDGFNLTLASKVMHQVVEIPFTHSRTSHFDKLMPGTTYSITIETTSVTKKSHPITISITTVPEPPMDLQFVVQDENSAYLFWKPPRGDFDNFELSYNIPGTNETTCRTTSRGNNFRIKDLIPGAEYLFQIKTVKGMDVSEVIEKRLKTKPEKPQMLEVSNIFATGFTLRWRAPIGNNGNYKVELVPDQGFVNITNLGNGTFKADVFDATPGIKYTATVSSVSSSFSKSVSRSFTTNETYAVSPDGLAVGLIGATAIMLIWNVPSHPNGRILSYVVEYKEVCPVLQANFIQVSTHADTTEFLLNNLKPGAVYKIRVAAENSAGIGAFSTFHQVVTAESAPGPVLALTATAVNHTAANVTWILPKRPNGKITQFSIIIKSVRTGQISKNISVNAEALFPHTLLECEDDSPTSTTPGSLISSSTPSDASSAFPLGYPTQEDSAFASIVVDQLKPYTTYLCEVSAFTKEGEGQAASALFRTSEWIPEDPPQNLIVSKITSRSFVISWDPPLTITGRLSYRVELVNPLGQISQNSTREVTYSFTNLLPFTKYEVFVIAETVVGAGPKDSVKVTTSSAVPGEVFDLKATEVGSKSAKIEWGKPHQPNGMIIQYQIIVLLLESQLTVQNITLTPENLQESRNSTESIYPGSEISLQVIDLSSEQLSYVVRELVPYTDYIISVSAFTIVGEGPPSSVSLKTKQYVPSSVQNVTYKNLTSTSILISWEPPAAPNGIITHYTLYALEEGTNEAFQRIVISNNITLTGLKKFTKYKMRVTASTSVGESDVSGEDDVFVWTLEDEPETPPENLTFKNITATSAHLSWSTPEKPNGIIIYFEVMYANYTESFVLNSTATSIYLENLKPFSPYNISVQAYTKYGHGDQTSLTALLLTEQGIPESAPENITYIFIALLDVLISFLPPLTPNGIVQYYTLYLSAPNNSEQFTAHSTNLSITIRGLSANENYTLKISASTSKGEGIQSQPMYILTGEGVPGSPPQSLTSKQLASTAVLLSWKPPLEPNGVLLHYTVTIWNTTTQLIVNETGTSVLLKDLSNAEYHAFVTASTKFGDGGMKSNNITFRTSESSNPMGTVSYVNRSSTSIQVFWNHPFKPAGSIQSYVVHYRNISGYFTQNITDFEQVINGDSVNASVILANLTKFSHYKLWMLACSSLTDEIQTSELIDVHTEEDVPSAPPQDLMIINYTADSVLVSWKPSPMPNGIVELYGFKIIDNTNGSIYFKNVSGSFQEARLSSFELLHEYFISVSAFTKMGNGDQFSNTVTFKVNESVPDAIHNLQCNATSWQSILIEWDPPLKSDRIVIYNVLIFGNNVQKVLSRNHTYIFTALQSNTTYQLSIAAANSLGQGESKNCTITTLTEAVPSAPRNLEIVGTQSTYVILRWKRPDIIPGHLRFVKINLQLRSASCMDWENKECIEAERIESYEIENVNNTMDTIVSELRKFRWYRFRISAGTNAGFSNYSGWISAKTTVGYPAGPPENVTVTVKSYDIIEVDWEIPADPPSYLIDVILTDNGESTMTIVRTEKQNKTCEISGLKPFTRYTIIVTAFTGEEEEAKIHGKASEPVTIRTLETLPEDAPQNFTLQKIPDEVTKVYVSFLPPSMPNGNIHGYQAIIHKKGEAAEIRINNLTTVEKNQTLNAVIGGLKGGNTYSIWVQAVNGAGIGPQTSEQTVIMDVKAPPKPKLKPVPALDKNGILKATSTTITIRMPVCYFTDEHGSIKKIQVIVTEIRAMNDKNISTWYDAYVKKPKPYFANEGFTNPPCSRTNTQRRSASEETYTIGAENSCQHNEKQICNGPLKSDKEYLFKFRATNFQDQFTDSDYSDPVKTLAEGLSGRTIEIVLAVTLCVLSIILLVIVGYVIARIRQKQKEGGTYSPRDAEIIDTKFKLDQMIAVTDLELKEEKLTRPINKKSFLQHVEELCVNNNLKFQEEFAELPKIGQELTSSDADLPWNQTKNRFANIKPYNNNRVKLMLEPSVPGSDFINASYMSGYLCPNEFIATQGPLPGTVADFWRMIWETRSKSIVMLTHCFEKGRIRCHQYWPEDNKPVTVFGDIVITKLAENIQADWTIRELKIEKYGDCMMVTHFNFTSWPEHGVPETSAALIHFAKLIRANRANDNTPIVVHCSAGVGRTGVFIALDHLIQHVKHHDFVDIFGFVADLRSERMCMVQNLAQYMFLHQCALDLMNNKGNSRSLWFVNYAALQKMDSLDTMEGDVELEWEETTM
ncbi:phosphatidylinositol phosphatase PTPRQ isoform X2 [Mobula birostris]|uniref:phosphatidylinositol phosphatase PTPRQ isoform X2 n=1 Tax=Mobula birostris TaxID=1983395 RepID=UPI003B27FEFD